MSLPWSNPYRSTQRSLERVWGLTEATALAVVKLIIWARYYGIPVEVYSGRRSNAQQASLYYTRVGVCAGCPVARPGTSDHELGEAVDVKFPLSNWAGVEYLAAAAGLKWGGRFSTPDYPHFYR